jgi:hypothetical protein
MLRVMGRHLLAPDGDLHYPVNRVGSGGTTFTNLSPIESFRLAI